MKTFKIAGGIFMALIAVASGVYQVLENNVALGICIINGALFASLIIPTFKCWWPILSPPYARIGKLIKLHIVLRKYDHQFNNEIRNHIINSQMRYLQPIPGSHRHWGTLFSLWYGRIKIPKRNKINRIRWSLLSDLYIYQEQLDLNVNRFATELDLYAKSILLNFYLTVDPLGLVNRRIGTSGAPTRIIWVITKMMPIDWPLCDVLCSKTAGPHCLSGNVGRENEVRFLRNYMDSLKAGASLRPNDNGDVSFCRHIVISNSQFTNINAFKTFFNNHWTEYFRKLHRNISEVPFGKSYVIFLDDDVARTWPKILNDAVFYGYRYPGSSSILWEWAICTTYTPGHPTILLQLYDLHKDIKCLDDETNGICEKLGYHNDKLYNFTNWIGTQAAEIEEPR